MNTSFFIAKRIRLKDNEVTHLSKPIIRIATGGIALGLAAMMLTIFIVKGFQQEVRERAVAFGGHVQIIKNSLNNSSETLPLDENNTSVKNVNYLENVKHVQQFLTKNGIIKTKTDNEGIIMKAVGKNYDWGFIGSHIVEGKIIDPVSDTSASLAMISKTTANRLSLQCGDPLFVYFILTDSLVKIKYESGDTIVQTNSDAMKVYLQTEEAERPDTLLMLKYKSKVKKFKIKAIYETGMEEYDKKIVFTCENTLRKICGWSTGQTGAFEVILKDFDKLNETGEEISEVIRADVNLSSYTIKDSNPGIFEWLDMHDTTAWIVIILMIIVAVINMVSALIILIIEKIKMIGLLKTLGMRTGQIIMIFMYQAGRIILLGLATGNVLGLSLSTFQFKTHFFKLDQSTYYMPFIPVKFEWGYLLLLNAGTFSICMLFMLLPCLLIAKTSPIRSIRFN